MIALTDDGDLIYGLGYVALYAAYLEVALEEVFSAMNSNALTVRLRMV